MDDHINVGHPFYFPTQVVLVDDDPDFLDGITLMLEDSLSYRLFHSASEGLSYVNHAHQQVSFLQRCYSNYKTGPQESDSLSHVDIGRLHEEIYNPSRFQTTSTVVVDYAMPEMNGLEFLMSLKNPFIKKVLLTGQADMDLAIKAFNKQLIDQFIDKHDPRLKQILNGAIGSFQDQYFRSSFKLITDPIIANNHDAFLTDAKFQEFFTGIRNKTACVEYYLVDSPRTGYLMVDKRGIRRAVLIFTEEALVEHASLLKSLNAPHRLVSEVSRGESLPTFDDNEEILTADHAFILNWEKHYNPGVRVNSRKTWFATVVPEEQLAERYTGNILPYADFIESNSMNREIIH